MNKFVINVALSFILLTVTKAFSENLNKEPELKKPFVIEVESAFLSSDWDSKITSDFFLNLLKKQGSVIFLNEKDYLEKQKNENNSDFRINALPIYEGAPIAFEKKLDVVKISAHFFAIKSGKNDQYKWSEERFMKVEESQEANTKKINQAINGVCEDFFDWLKSNFPEEKSICFYVKEEI